MSGEAGRGAGHAPQGTDCLVAEEGLWWAVGQGALRLPREVWARAVIWGHDQSVSALEVGGWVRSPGEGEETESRAEVQVTPP